MPDVRITVRASFIVRVRNVPTFCCEARKAVSRLFETDLSNVAVKLEHYAPGCEEGRPDLTVSVSINEGDRAPRQAELVQELANGMKAVVDGAVFGNTMSIKVKAILDLNLRKTAITEV